MTFESFSFDKGVNLKKKNALLLENGEVVTVTGFNYFSDGVLECRPAVTKGALIDSKSTSIVHGIHHYNGSTLAASKRYCVGDQAQFNHMFHPSHENHIDILHGNTTPRFVDYQKFTFVVDDETNRAYINDNAYNWGIVGPQSNADVVAGAAGNPSGTYNCYVTFTVNFPNGKTHETGPSRRTQVVLSSEKASWSNIPLCEYTGNDITIYRNLYRSVSGVNYLVDTITDNTTTTYTDNVSDANLQLASIMTTSAYGIPPTGSSDLAMYLQRMFVIKDNKIYWSEPYIPFGFKNTSNVSVSRDDEELLVIAVWADQLYMASKNRWFRLQGTDPDTWAIKFTFADEGIINRDTVQVTRYGILGLQNHGIQLFDGAVNKNITENILGREFFDDISDLDACYSEFDGERYWFYYPSTGSTCDSCFVLDFSHYPEVRVFFDNFIPSAIFWHKEDATKYLAYDRHQYSESGTETIPTVLLTGDVGFKNITTQKNLEYLYYDIDTGGVNVTVTIYADGASAHTLTLNTSARTRKRSSILPQIEGYRFSIGLTCADSSSLKIYTPWVLSATEVGD